MIQLTGNSTENIVAVTATEAGYTGQTYVFKLFNSSREIVLTQTVTDLHSGNSRLRANVFNIDTTGAEVGGTGFYDYEILSADEAQTLLDSGRVWFEAGASSTEEVYQ